MTKYHEWRSGDAIIDLDERVTALEEDIEEPSCL
jgi:hypothetical protein|tara:strand:- start:5995 stop:6096 length:102 start_codon:yes stop_codon:yes gene_type:complete